MKDTYEQLELEVIVFNTEDVISTSPPSTGEGGGQY